MIIVCLSVCLIIHFHSFFSSFFPLRGAFGIVYREWCREGPFSAVNIPFLCHAVNRIVKFFNALGSIYYIIMC